MISVWISGRLFYTLGYNPILIYLFFLKFSSFGHWEFFQLVPLSSWHICDIVGLSFHPSFKLLFYNLAPKDASDSFCYISCPSPRVIQSTISPGSPWSLHWRMVFQKLRSGYWCAFCNWAIIATRASQMIEQRDICMCILTCVIYW